MKNQNENETKAKEREEIKEKRKRVCFFGIYDPEYSRNRVLLRGFRENGWEVFECRVDPRKFRGVKKYLELFREYNKLKEKKFGLVLVAFPGQSVVWLARILFGREIILDAFLSLFDSNVRDRKLYGAMSVRGVRDWLLDFFSCRLTGKVLLETNAHIDFFAKTFHLSREKFVRVFVGTDPDIFAPAVKTDSSKIFRVHFHGTFIPLQGVEYIVRAASIVRQRNERDIVFEITGSGQESGKVKKLAEDLELDIKQKEGEGSVAWRDGRVSLETLAEQERNADVCLGIFGKTEKAGRVIPNKVFEAIAAGKPVLTADSPAIRELFTDRENIMLCRAGDAKDLAEKIILLKNDVAVREKIAHGGYELFRQKCTPKMLVHEMLERLTR